MTAPAVYGAVEGACAASGHEPRLPVEAAACQVLTSCACGRVTYHGRPTPDRTRG